MQTLRNLGYGKKKGVTPVIATILLIAGTIVLALVVGAYTFGLFGSNVKTIQLNSASLFSGPLPLSTSTSCSTTSNAYLSLSFNNPGASTNVTSITLTGSSLSSGVQTMYITGGSTCAALGQPKAGDGPQLGAGTVTPVTVYFTTTGATATTLASGQTFNYVINFANGQSIAGSLLAS